MKIVVGELLFLFISTSSSPVNFTHDSPLQKILISYFDSLLDMFQLSLHLKGFSERGNNRSLNLMNNIISSIKRFQILSPIFFKDQTNFDWMIEIEKKLNSLIELIIQNNFENKSTVVLKEYHLPQFHILIKDTKMTLPFGLSYLFELNSYIHQQQWNFILSSIFSHQLFSFRFEKNSLLITNTKEWNLSLMFSFPHNSYLLPYEKYINSEKSTTNISESISNIQSLLPIIKIIILTNQNQFSKLLSKERVKFLSFSLGKFSFFYFFLLLLLLLC